MQAIDKSKRTIKQAALSGTALALILTPTAALAHSSHDNGDRGNDNRRSASSQQKQRGDNRSDRNDRDRGDRNNRFSTWWQQNRDRQKLTCDQKQAVLNQRAADAKEKYAKKLTGLNIIYSGVTTYVSSGDVTVENYDALNAQVAADQTTATNAVNAIAPTQLNCPDPNAAAAASDDNKTFHSHENKTNESINAARQALNAYKRDLNTLFEAVINS